MYLLSEVRRCRAHCCTCSKEMGASVLVVGKAYPTNSQTSMAQGGMNAALGNVGEDHICFSYS